MGIFVEEAAAFIISGFISAAALYEKDIYNTDKVRFIFFICMLVLGIFGVLDVAVDHLFEDDTAGPQQATP